MEGFHCVWFSKVSHFGGIYTYNIISEVSVTGVSFRSVLYLLRCPGVFLNSY